jgi:hypothetical protein
MSILSYDQLAQHAELTVNVTLRPALDVGDYTVVRELEIDPNQIWISYGQEPIGQIKVLERISTARVSVEKTGDEKSDVIAIAKTTTTTLRKPEVTGRVVGMETEGRSPWTLIISLIVVISLIVYAIIRTRQKPEEEEEGKWYVWK